MLTARQDRSLWVRQVRQVPPELLAQMGVQAVYAQQEGVAGVEQTRPISNYILVTLPQPIHQNDVLTSLTVPILLYLL